MSDTTDSTNNSAEDSTASTNEEQVTLPTVEEFEKLKKERDNYRTMSLGTRAENKKLKESLKESGVDVEAIENEAVTKVTKEFEKKISDVTRKMDELALSFTNKASASIAAGSSQDATAPKDSTFSAEQIADLRRQGFDDKKIERLKQNLNKFR